MSTLKTLTDQLLDELSRTGQMTAQAHTYINQAVDHYKLDAFKFNEAVSVMTASAAVEYHVLPADFGEDYTIMIDDQGDGDYFPLNMRTMQEMDRLYTSPSDYKGQPVDGCIFKGQLRLGPVPDCVKTASATVQYTLQLAYRALPLTATSSAQTNIFFQNAKELIISRAGNKMAKKILRQPQLAADFRQDELEARTKHRSQNAQYAMTGRS